MIKDTNYLTYFDITQSWDTFAVILIKNYINITACMESDSQKPSLLRNETILMSDFHQNCEFWSKKTKIFWVKNGHFYRKWQLLPL